MHACTKCDAVFPINEYAKHMRLHREPASEVELLLKQDRSEDARRSYRRFRTTSTYDLAQERFLRLTKKEHNGNCDRCRLPFEQSDSVEVTPRKYLVLITHLEEC